MRKQEVECKFLKSISLQLFLDWIETNINKTKTDALKLPPHQANKIVRFFIRDLLNCDKIDCYFKFWDIVFNQVYICGTITSLFTRNEKYYLAGEEFCHFCIKLILLINSN